jgi:hypothetical protein
MGRRRVAAPTELSADIASDISKYTGQSVRPADYSLNDLESNRLAGIFRVIWSNLCTRHIPDKLSRAGIMIGQITRNNAVYNTKSPGA